MSARERRKGQTAEREVCSLLRGLLNVDARRRVRQHDGDSDVLGVDGWSVEVKRRSRATPADIRAWWRQAVDQAIRDGCRPALFYRLDRQSWRVIWPLSTLLADTRTLWDQWEFAIESDPEAWAAVVRETWAGPSTGRPRAGDASRVRALGH